MEPIRESIFEQGADVLVNPVNCRGVMGAGLARSFKKRFPEMYVEYRRAYQYGELRLGKIHVWNGPSVTVINFPTKYHWREGSDLRRIEDGLIDLRGYLIGAGYKARPKKLIVAIPPLGCGLGGLEWSDVSHIMDFCLRGLDDIDLRVCLGGIGDG